LNAAPALTGQSMGLIDEIKSVEEIINLTVTEFNKTLESLNNSKI
jgi:enoyl-[acyl-carrier protein] reductase II